MSFLNKLFSRTPTERFNLQTIPTLSDSVNNRTSSACPSCGTEFQKRPQRKTICTTCKQPVFIRAKQHIFNSDLLTEEQMQASDFYDELLEYGVSVEHFAIMEAKLAGKFGIAPTPYDVAWGVSNQFVAKLQQYASSPDELIQKAKMILFSQAKYQAIRGNDPSSYLAGVADYDRQIYARFGIGIDEYVIETKGCCSACSKEQGKKYTSGFLVENLRKGGILPIKGCTHKLDKNLKHSWCVCWLSPII